MTKENYKKYRLLKNLPKKWPEISLSDDLYLAWACLHNLPGAIESFQQKLEPIIYKTLIRMKKSHNSLPDIIQLVYTKLFTFRDGKAPAIVQFCGLGKLANWIKLLAMHLAIDLQRKNNKEFAAEDDTLDLLNVSLTDPEVDYLKKTYCLEFKQAFQTAFETLSARERNLLRHKLLDQLSFERIGAIYHVDKSTVSRWMARIKNRLHSKTKKLLLERLQVSKDELENILRLIQSRLSVSWYRILNQKS
jgi:RNA polymerase sigma-70 factor